MTDKKQVDGEVDPLALRKIYPDAGAVFSFQPEALRSIFLRCLVVLDTNVLLVPYNTGKESLSKIKEIYSELASNKRLIIPGQVAREFARLRPDKLRAVFQQLSRKRDKYSMDPTGYPLLESLAEYQEVVKLENHIDSQLAEYRKKLGSLLAAIQSWYWNDPVSLLYRELFDHSVIYDPEVAEKDFLADLNFRNSNNMPPGYKDSSKKNGGAGDLLIWNTILKLGGEREEHVIFVSGDEKPDWWYQSEKQALYPRFELVEEFRRASNGKSLHIIRFAEFLRLSGATPDIVQEVEVGAAITSIELASPSSAGRTKQARAVENAVYLWIKENLAKDLYRDVEGIDFIGVAMNDVIGFDVKFISNPFEIFDQYLEANARLSKAILEFGLDRAYIVLAARSVEILDSLRVAHRSRLPKFIGLITGVVDDEGIFREIEKLDPPGV